MGGSREEARDAHAAEKRGVLGADCVKRCEEKQEEFQQRKPEADRAGTESRIQTAPDFFILCVY